MKRGLIGPKVALTFVLPFGDSLSIQFEGESTWDSMSCACYFKGLKVTLGERRHTCKPRVGKTYCPTLGEKRHRTGEETYCHTLWEGRHTVPPQSREDILSIPWVEKTCCHSLGQMRHTFLPRVEKTYCPSQGREDILSLPRGEGRGEVALINYNTVPLSVVKYSHDFSFP